MALVVILPVGGRSSFPNPGRLLRPTPGAMKLLVHGPFRPQQICIDPCLVQTEIPQSSEPPARSSSVSFRRLAALSARFRSISSLSAWFSAALGLAFGSTGFWLFGSCI